MLSMGVKMKHTILVALAVFVLLAAGVAMAAPVQPAVPPGQHVALAVVFVHREYGVYDVWVTDEVGGRLPLNDFLQRGYRVAGGPVTVQYGYTVMLFEVLPALER